MKFWIVFWTLVLILGLGVFAGLAIVVSIGGFFDIKSLFKSIEEQHAESPGASYDGERDDNTG